MTPAEEAQLADVARAYCVVKGVRFCGLAGTGAFKAAYRIENTDGRAIALKVYLPGAVTDRAVREIEALQKLSALGNPALPSFISLEGLTLGGIQYWVSAEEFIEGGSLSSFAARNGLLSRDQVIALATPLCSALSDVAASSLVHRDVKPDNIVLRADGSPVLVDFGLVRNLAQHSLTQTWLPQGPGTPIFASPEQLTNDKDLIGWRTDQFSLGVSLSFVGFGNHPYAHAGDAPDAVVARVSARQPLSPDFTRWANGIGLTPIIRMVAPWPVGRYRLPRDLREAWATL